MSYVLAVDIGTSFTAAAVVRSQQGATAVPECLPLGLRGSAVPSVVYYPEEGPILVGEAAERRGLDSPGRVVREFKRRVGDAVPICVGALSLPPEEVFATMAHWVADRAAEREGGPPSEIVLTHPASWGSHRTSVIRNALAAKGLENVTLLTEPEAAALHYASQVRVEDGSTIAVYDLGGGTFDTAVLRKAGGNRFDLLGRPEGIEDLGGADFDAAVFRYVGESTGGALAALDPAQPGVLAALTRLRRECVEAKEALSSDSEASISVLLPGIQQQVRLVRAEFETLIEESIRDTVDALEMSLLQLELEPADLTAVLLIGGSSRIPLVAQLISEQLERPIAVDADPKSSICLGAAVSAVLGQPAPGAAATPEETAVSPGPVDGNLPLRRASWSRKTTTAANSAAGSAHRRGHQDRGGAHAPKPRVRLTAIAAAAAFFTVLTANAAQGPEGFPKLTTVFMPEAGASDGKKAGEGVSGGSNTFGPAAGAAGQADVPLAAIQPAVPMPDSSQEAGLEVEASPTKRSSGTVTDNSAAGEAPPGSPVIALDAGGGPAEETPSGPGTPYGASDPVDTPVPVTSDPVPTDAETGIPPSQDPTTDPPSQDPTTDPPPQDPTTEPTTPDPTSNPSVTDPTTSPPMTHSAPSSEPPASGATVDTASPMAGVSPDSSPAGTASVTTTTTPAA